MAVLTIPNVFNNGEVIDAPEMNSNFTAVKNFVEGLSQGNNFDTGAITTSDIADNAITSAKIATAAVTSAKIQTSVSLTTPVLGAATATSISASGQVTSHVNINPTTGAYTLVLGDDGKVVEMSNASGTTLTVPLFSSVAFPTGTIITIIQTGAGQTTIAGAVGVTVNGTPGLKLRAQYSAAALICRGTNLWIAVGDLAA